MIRETNILRQHGKQAIPDLHAVVLPDIFRGRPVITDQITETESRELENLCPTAAISAGPVFSIDLGKCVFCRECFFACPGKIRFTNDYHLAVNRREDLIITAGVDIPLRVDPGRVRPEIQRIFRHSLKLRQVSAGGDNSCEMELNAATNVNFDMGRLGFDFVASPRHADGIVVTGPVTSNMAEALRLTWEAVPEPKILVLAGTEAISGGLFAGSPALDRRSLDLYPVDLWIPGNPLHPLSFIHGLLELRNPAG